MTIEMGALIAGILAIIGGAIAYGRLSSSVETNKEAYEKESKETKDKSDEEHRNIWKVIGDLRNGVESHLRDSSDKRLELEKEMGSIRGNMSNLNVKLDTILDKIEDIKKTMEKIDNKN